MEHVGFPKNIYRDHTLRAHNLAGLGLYGAELREELLLAADEYPEAGPDEQLRHVLSLADSAQLLRGWTTIDGCAVMLRTGVETTILNKALSIPGLKNNSEAYFDVHERLLYSLSADIMSLRNADQNNPCLHRLLAKSIEMRSTTAHFLQTCMRENSAFYNRILLSQVDDILRPKVRGRMAENIIVSSEYL